MAHSSGKQLIDAAIERDSELHGALSEGLGIIAKRLKVETDLESFLRNPAVELADKKRALEVAAPEVPPQSHNTVLAFLRRGLFEELDGAIMQILAASLEREGKVDAVVYTATEMEKSQRKSLALALQKFGGKQVQMKEFVDADLIGGIRVKVKDTLFDGSIKGRLQQLTKRIAALR